MPLYFQKTDGKPVTRFDYSCMCVILPCEIPGGYVIFGACNETTFKVLDRERERFDGIRKIFVRQGYMEVNEPKNEKHIRLEDLPECDEACLTQ